MNTTTEKLLTVGELAGVLNVSRSTIYKRKGSGRLPSVKLPGSSRVYFRADSINKLIDSCEQR